MTAAPIPPAVIDGGMAAIGLLAWVAASKYLDHLPLYRIKQIAAHQGALTRSTLAEWIGRIGVALQPLFTGSEREWAGQRAAAVSFSAAQTQNSHDGRDGHGHGHKGPAAE